MMNQSSIDRGFFRSMFFRQSPSSAYLVLSMLHLLVDLTAVRWSGLPYYHGPYCPSVDAYIVLFHRDHVACV